MQKVSCKIYSTRMGQPLPHSRSENDQFDGVIFCAIGRNCGLWKKKSKNIK